MSEYRPPGSKVWPGPGSSLLEQIQASIEELEGPYGISWYGPGEIELGNNACQEQTGYVFGTIAEAAAIAKRGPTAAHKLGHQTDLFCDCLGSDHDLGYAEVENENGFVTDVSLAGP